MAHITAEAADMLHPKIAAKQTGFDGDTASGQTPKGLGAGNHGSR
jgi:hypothetical protein